MSCLSGLAEAFQHRTRPAAVGLLTVHRTAYTPQIAGPSTPCGCSFRSPPARRPAVGLGVHSRASRGQVQAVCAIKKGSEKNVVCSKTLVIKPGQEKRVLPRCRDIVDFTRGRMASRGSGVLAFECMQDRYEKNVLHFWERYDSNANMGKHNNTPELQAFMREVSTYLEGPIGMALYEWKDGKIGQQCIQGGPKGEGGLDDATGAGGAGGASMKQSSNTVDLGKVRRGDEGDAFGMGFKFPWQKNKK